MSSMRFPSRLKPIVNRNYGQTRGSNITRAEAQGGVPRQARDNYFEPVPITMSLICSRLSRQVFWNFIAQIHGGASSFIMPHDTGQGIEDHVIQINSDINETTNDQLNWVISFTALAERTAIQEETELTPIIIDMYDAYGEKLQQFLNAYHIYVTTPDFIADYD